MCNFEYQFTKYSKNNIESIPRKWYNIYVNKKAARQEREKQAMTNAEIIYRASEELVMEGKLNAIVVNGTSILEEIHTFQGWKERGFKVKKGEKSDIKIPIWKYSSKKVEDKETHEEKEKSSMFMKTAAFFRSNQVERIG